MKYISGSTFNMVSLLLLLLLSGRVAGQDTLRTYGPRLGIDLARFLYLLADPSQIGAEASADFEIYRNVYPIVELGYNTVSDSRETFDYQSGGNYFRAGIDYNILPLKDRSVHHMIAVGFRYGRSGFTHKSEDVVIQGYWGSYSPAPYENSLVGHWAELVGSMKAELVPNLFLGWSLRVKFLLDKELDPVMAPELIPGYGNGREGRVFGFSYSLLYKIPLIKK
jgi:hypothetical protein